jgi:hypothetical protein
MRINKSIKKSMALVMAVLLAASCCDLQVFAENAEGDTQQAAVTRRIVSITSVEEFAEFAKECVEDVYSENLYVMLKSDLDFSGYDIKPVPIFSGTFNGNGHRISGFTYDDIGSNEGLFRYVTETGVIKNLSVVITMKPDGDQENIGGICGENRGTIENCNVMGDIEGLKNTGGIAGVNEVTGLIRNCSAGASVRGETYTGGIVGYNYGRVEKCTNIGGVNEEPYDSADGTGGIAGYSEGTLRGCINRGIIGYKRTGYNSGGIAGIQNGDVVDCLNEGEVYAKRNAGGIAGQNLPSSNTEYSNKLKEISNILDTMPDDFRVINSELNDIVDDVTDIMDEIDNTISNISDILHENGDKISDDLSVASENVRDNARDITAALDDMTIEGRLAIEDADRVAAALATTGDALSAIPMQDLMESVGDASVVLANATEVIAGSVAEYGMENSENIQQLVQLVALYSQFNSAGDAENAALVLAQLGSLGGQMYENSESMRDDISTSTAQLSSTMQQVNENIERVNEAYTKFQEALTELDAQVKRLDEGFDALDAMMKELNTVAWELDDAMDKINVFIDSATDDFNEILDISDENIQSMDDQLEVLYNRVDDSSDRIKDYVDSIIDKVDAAGDLFSELLDGPDEVTNDISESAEEGLGSAIIGCSNTGAVNADYNAGGIAGIAAKDNSRNLEEVNRTITDLVNGDLGIDEEGYLFGNIDSEDVTTIADSLIGDAFTVYRMHISSCSNTGDITVKSDYAGGIVGYGGEGMVLNCSNQGLVTTDGEYCGGIMGYSEGVIKKCNSSGTLVSTGKAGGIAGYGHDIYDCNAMVAIDSDSGTIGAIAYNADGELLNNRFASDVLSGVDGINRKGKAERVSYEELKSIFEIMTVTFIGADGEIIAKMNVEYGEGIDTLPTVMNKEKEYWVWDDFDSSRIVTSMVINGEYHNRLSTLSVNDGNLQPAFLAEGDFYPDQELSVQPLDSVAQDFGKNEIYYAGTVNVTGHDGGTYEKPLVVRMKTDKDGDVYILNNGVYEKTYSERDGSYIRFDIPNGASFVYVESHDFPYAIVAVVCVAVLIILLAAAGVAAKKKRRKRNASKED